MSPARSLQARMLTGTAVWSTGLVAAAVAASIVWLSAHFERAFREQLWQHLRELVSISERGPNGDVRLTRPPSDPRFALSGSGLYWQIEGGDGFVITSPSLSSRRLDVPRGERGTERRDGPAAEVLVVWEIVPLAGATVRYAVARQTSQLARDEALVRYPIAPIAGAAALICLIVGALVVRSALRSLDDVRLRLAAVRAGATRRLVGTFPGELQPLVDELNALLQHNERALARATTQAANLAHALKTPLAVIMSEASRLDGGATRATDAIREEIARVQSRIDGHLARSRAAASVHGLGARTSVAESVAGVVRVLERAHAARGITVSSTAAPGAFRGERHDLDEMLGNVLDNACKWARSRVTVESSHDEDTLRIVVDDDGPGLAEGVRGAAFDRGVRLDESVPGSGHGLAIVRDLVETYGGSVSLDDSPLGGLRVSITLSAAPT